MSAISGSFTFCNSTNNGHFGYLHNIVAHLSDSYQILLYDRGIELISFAEIHCLCHDSHKFSYFWLDTKHAITPFAMVCKLHSLSAHKTYMALYLGCI